MDTFFFFLLMFRQKNISVKKFQTRIFVQTKLAKWIVFDTLIFLLKSIRNKILVQNNKKFWSNIENFGETSKMLAKNRKLSSKKK